VIWNCECGAPHTGWHPLDHPLPKASDWYGYSRLSHPSWPGPCSDLRQPGWVYTAFGHRETSGAVWLHESGLFGEEENTRFIHHDWQRFTFEAREQDIRWKNEALHKLGMIESGEVVILPSRAVRQ
jgi:hypothetical protein